ncbi:histidine ABC transporter permease [Devosia limi DSM 17137]|uniref:Histidine ABC transporter permease n=1 Tax=Devosia limi DSM 17137 TaxID=1121477 RepID=A0A0F5LRL4_9HYPH|nr:ABC transporter permease subunit [Devosia limi]KKB84218.1 histidine ABC transporter permease [Devosia limi DSM 17137]KKB84297.1 histidine ABC transporter permease [Devosia limi DSM 17137]SHE83434.1 polar amino acid transport system permease protein [Devosia limi DSM 17137]
MQVLLNEIVAFWPAVLFNLYFAAASIPFGFVFAVLLALGKASTNPWISRLSRGYIYAFRGSPLFIQFFMFYSLALSLNISVWKPMGVSWFVLHPLFIGPLVLMLNTAAYTAEIFYGALRAVPRGEVEAARAYGMSRFQQFRSVIWPNLIRLAWPAYTNEVVFLFHATAIVYFALPVIGAQKDLMITAKEFFERDYNAFLHFSVAALYFLAVTLVVFFLFGLVYQRLMRHMPAPPRLRYAPRWMR